MPVTPLQICKVIRESFVGAEEVYMNGSCVMFHGILRNIFPKALPYWSSTSRHCITKIGNKYYDITGEVKKSNDYVLDNKDTYSSFKIAAAFPVGRSHIFRMAQKKTCDKF